jgi:hypothetical protein
MASLTLDKAYLVGAWLESLFYGLSYLTPPNYRSDAHTGINVVLFCACLYILFSGRNRAEVEKTFLAVLVTQFLLSTASLALGMRVRGEIFYLWALAKQKEISQMIVVGFIKYGGIPGATLEYMADFSNPLRRAKIVTISVNVSATH